MSDAGFVMDDSASHQSGLIVDSNVERETREEGHYGTSAPLPLSGAGGQPAVSKRPHFQLRSNSVRDQGPEQGKIVLKSALKKSNTSAEILTERIMDALSTVQFTYRCPATAKFSMPTRGLSQRINIRQRISQRSGTGGRERSRRAAEEPGLKNISFHIMSDRFVKIYNGGRKSHNSPKYWFLYLLQNVIINCPYKF